LPQFSNDSVFVRNDTILVQPARPFCYPAVLVDPNPADTVIMFPVSSWFGVGGNTPPPYATLSQQGVNPAFGDICWTPGCELAGQWVDMVVGGYDPHDCLGYNVVFDTVRIKVLGATPRILTHRLPNGGDTAWVKVGEAFCYEFTAKDADPFDGLIVTPTGGPFVGLGGTAVKQDTGVNPVKGTVCWTPQCDHEGQTFTFELTAVDTNYCKKSDPVEDRVMVIVEAAATLTLPDTVSACLNAEVTLAASASSAGSFSWSPGALLSDSTIFQPTIVAQEAMRFYLNYTDPEQCFHRDSLWLEILPLPLVSVIPDSARVCPGDSVLLEARSTTMVFARWEEAPYLSNLTSPQTYASPSESQRFSVAVEDANGCVARSSAWVEVMPPASIDAGEDIRHCDVLPIQLEARGGNRYQWEPEDYLQGAQSATPLADPGFSMEYIVTGWNEEGCLGSDTVSVIRIDPLPRSISSYYLPCDRQGRVELEVAGGDSVLWSDGSNERFRILNVEDSILLSAQIFEEQCPGIPDSIFLLPMASFPVADFSYSPEAGIAPLDVQFFNLSKRAVRYAWDFGRGFPQSYEEHPTHGFTGGNWDVVLVAWSEEGCTDTMTKNLFFEYPSVFIPSAFSPNNDGHNDEFYIGSYGISRFDFRVFSRWGKEIFHSTDPNFRWDGNYKGENVPEGVYVYKLTTYSEANREKVYTGTVTLIR
jgi:gliding motility-associated-like protein